MKVNIKFFSRVAFLLVVVLLNRAAKKKKPTPLSLNTKN